MQKQDNVKNNHSSSWQRMSHLSNLFFPSLSTSMWETIELSQPGSITSTTSDSSSSSKGRCSSEGYTAALPLRCCPLSHCLAQKYLLNVLKVFVDRGTCRGDFNLFDRGVMFPWTSYSFFLLGVSLRSFLSLTSFSSTSLFRSVLEKEGLLNFFLKLSSYSFSFLQEGSSSELLVFFQVDRTPPRWRSLSCLIPSLAISSSSLNQSTRLSFLKRRLWFRGNLVFRLYLLGSVSPKSSWSIHSLKFSSSSLSQNSFYLSMVFSWTSWLISLSLRQRINAYFAYSALLDSFFSGERLQNIQNEFLAVVIDFQPTDFFICSLMRLTSCSFFLISWSICSFLARNIVIIFLSSSRSLLAATSLFLPFTFSQELQFQILPNLRMHYQRFLCACSMKLWYLSFSKVIAAMSSLALLLKLMSFCRKPINSTTAFRVCSLSWEQGSYPRGSPQPVRTEREQALCSVNQLSS